MEMTFEEKLARLNEIVNKIQQDDISIDESIKLYEEGNALIKELEEALKKAEEKVEHVIEVNKK